MKTVTLIIPCFNEYESLSLLIKELEKVDSGIEFLIVDNGSKDNTKNYLKNIENKFKNISTFYIEKNEGYGHGVFTALSTLQNSEFIGWIHGDLQFEFSELNNVYKDLKSYKFTDKKIFYKAATIFLESLIKVFSFSVISDSFTLSN